MTELSWLIKLCIESMKPKTVCLHLKDLVLIYYQYKSFIHNYLIIYYYIIINI